MIRFRKIRESDLDQIATWRMREDITRYMRTDVVLTHDGQKQWLKKVEEDESQKYWVIELDGKAIGVMDIIQIDYEKKVCEWGYYIGNTDCRSIQLALNVEYGIYDYVLVKMQFEELVNEVFEDNKGVVKLHELCGSKVTAILKNHVVKNGVAHNVVHMSITQKEWMEKRKNLNYELTEVEE